MPEPISTTLIVTAAISGASGVLIRELAGKGAEWIINLATAQSPAVQEKIHRNTTNYLNRLAERVSRLEADLPSEKEIVFQESLSDPSTALMMRKALLSGAVTDNDDRHIILSELIAQRLTAGADDMIALVGGAACDIINALSSRHIRLLGVISTVHKIRPSQPGLFSSQRDYDDAVSKWWDNHLSKLCSSELINIRPLDLEHLVGLSCISTIFGKYNLLETLSLSNPSNFNLTDLEIFEQFSWWTIFQHIWNKKCEHTTLTSIGSLIGILYHDELLKNPTHINW